MLARVTNLVDHGTVGVRSLAINCARRPSISHFGVIVDVRSSGRLGRAVDRLTGLVSIVGVVGLSRTPFVDCRLTVVGIHCSAPRIHSRLTDLTGLFRTGIISMGLGSLVLHIAKHRSRIGTLVGILAPCRVLRVTQAKAVSLSQKLIPIGTV